MGVTPALDELAGQVDSVTFTGHSLGGGVAVYLSLLFTELLDLGTGPPSPDMVPVRCFSFGAPGTLSLDVARSLRKRVCSFCLGEDIVPRLSYGHVLDLHDRAVAASGAGLDERRTFPEHDDKKLFSPGRC